MDSQSATHPMGECEAGIGGQNADTSEEKSDNSIPHTQHTPPLSRQHRALLNPLVRSGRVHALYSSHEPYVLRELDQIAVTHGLHITRAWDADHRRLEFELDAIDRLKVAELIGVTTPVVEVTR